MTIFNDKYLSSNFESQSRRSPIQSRNGMVATSQPLASEIGLSILKQGGNAMDAAISIAAALNVVEPCQTGLGGDCFVLFYDSNTKKVHGINGSGYAPKNLNINTVFQDQSAQLIPHIREKNQDEFEIIDTHANSVTVPGTSHTWINAYELFGSKNLQFSEILNPAVKLATQGWPCSNVTSILWNKLKYLLERDGMNNSHELLTPAGKAPLPGEVITNLTLANTLRELGECGDLGLEVGYHRFMSGRVGQEIINAIAKYGGHMSIEDLLNFKSELVQPIFSTYENMNIYEIPPNGQGIAALLAFNFLKEVENQFNIKLGCEDAHVKHGSGMQFHILIEVMRLAFVDAKQYVADSRFGQVPVETLLSESQAKERIRNCFDINKAKTDITIGSPSNQSNTVSFQVVDCDGNSVSFVNSNQKGFGTGIIPKGCGFTLQNRGNNFSLNPDHPNCLMPLKRPQHTIIPCIVTHTGSNEMYCTLTNMGGFMQPQGHLQLLVSMLKYNQNPQRAIDAFKFCILDGNSDYNIAIENGVSQEVINELINKGHKILIEDEIVKKNYASYERYGRAQIIFKDRQTGVLIGGSDGRGDGCAIGQ